MGDYKLSASLEQHEDDVRGVVFPHSNSVLSASRDATVRLWKLLSEHPPKYDCSIISHSSAFINSVAYLPSTKDFPDGLIISGGKDTVIEVRQPGKPPEEDAEALLLGHSHNVCALDVSPAGDFIVSGSWDGSARLWGVGKWECQALLEGHEGSVWTVLAYDPKTIITGCADTQIRIFDSRGKFSHAIQASKEPVRALCRVPAGHSSEAEFASAGNDGIISLWKLDGRQVGELIGHENFIYALTSLPTGELASSGEDRTVRIWRGTECVQTITHPAISVWSVAACSENGDIVSGASDRKVRIFSRTKDRLAEPEAIEAFNDSVRASAIPQQQVGDVNKEELPGPEFLAQKSGTKEGQTVMIKESDGSVSAHTWSQGSRQWTRVGTVVDAVGSSGKLTSYAGQDYDYVFDVDIEDGKPPLKLPYNLSQNPFEAATKFIQDNELPMTYLDQVAGFITTNTAGATIGQPPQGSASSDPWGSGAYTPGQQNTAGPAPSNQSPGIRPKVLPQTAYLSIKSANLRTIRKKIEELNQQLISEGSKDVALDQKLLADLDSMMSPLQGNLAGTPTANPALTVGVALVVFILTSWPPSHRLPALDLLRLLAAATPAVAEYRADGNIIDVLITGAFEDKDRENNTMLGTRAFGNLFETAQGRSLAETEFDRLHELVKTSSAGTANRNLTIAAATLYLNYTVLLTSSSHSSLPSSIDKGLLLLDDLCSLISAATDSEAVYRALVATGTLLGLGEELHEAAKDIYDLSSALGKAEKAVKEPRIKGVVAEIRALVKA